MSFHALGPLSCAFSFSQFSLKGKNCWEHPLRDTPSSPWADKTVLQTLQAPESTMGYHIVTPMAEMQSHLYKSSISLVRKEIGHVVSNVKALEIKCREVWVPRRKSYFIAQMADWPCAAEHYVRICIPQQPRQEELHYVDSTSALLYNNLVNTFCGPPGSWHCTMFNTAENITTMPWWGQFYVNHGFITSKLFKKNRKSFFFPLSIHQRRWPLKMWTSKPKGI